jgi:hypothetical protein
MASSRTSLMNQSLDEQVKPFEDLADRIVSGEYERAMRKKEELDAWQQLGFDYVCLRKHSIIPQFLDQRDYDCRMRALKNRKADIEKIPDWEHSRERRAYIEGLLLGAEVKAAPFLCAGVLAYLTYIAYFA